MRTVLVADNSETDRAAIVRAVLEADPSARVVEAENGRDAVWLMRRHRPDLSILDLYMSPVTGRKAAAEGRRMGLDVRVVTSSVPLSAASRSAVRSKSDVSVILSEWIGIQRWMEARPHWSRSVAAQG